MGKCFWSPGNYELNTLVYVDINLVLFGSLWRSEYLHSVVPCLHKCTEKIVIFNSTCESPNDLWFNVHPIGLFLLSCAAMDGKVALCLSHTHTHTHTNTNTNTNTPFPTKKFIYTNTLSLTHTNTNTPTPTKNSFTSPQVYCSKKLYYYHKEVKKLSCIR